MNTKELIEYLNESVFRKIKKTTHKDLENLADELLDDSVDLGLSVRWCKCNLGADSPEEFGDYYGWGMTEPYKKGVDDITEDFYNQFTASEIETDLTDETDAATIKLGKRYRMPTKEEILELIKKCDWKWTQMNGVDGYKVMNKRDHSKFIFLPAAGSLHGLSHFGVGRFGYYWSRSRDSALDGWRIGFSSDCCDMNGTYRFFGSSVRPVKISSITESVFRNIKNQKSSDLENDAERLIRYNEGDFFPNDDNKEGIVIYDGKDGWHPLTICNIKLSTREKNGKETTFFTFREANKEDLTKKRGEFPTYYNQRKGEWYVPCAEELEHLSEIISEGKFPARISHPLWSSTRSSFMPDYQAKVIHVSSVNSTCNNLKCFDARLDWKYKILLFKQISSK